MQLGMALFHTPPEDAHTASAHVEVPELYVPPRREHVLDLVPVDHTSFKL
jgi:hypothetical protein